MAELVEAAGVCADYGTLAEDARVVLLAGEMGNPRPQLFLPLAQHPASTVLVIARGAPSDPSIRGAFHNAIAGGTSRCV